MKKILAILAFFTMVPAFAQEVLPFEAYTMRIHDRVANTVNLEHTVYTPATRTAVTRDAVTGAWLATTFESTDGRSLILLTTEGNTVSSFGRPPKDLRPGEQTSGVMQMQAAGQFINLPVTIVVYVENGWHMTAVSGAGFGFNYVGRSASLTPAGRPVWEHVVIHTDGYKTNDLYAVRDN